jgi:hypothetical protein
VLDAQVVYRIVKTDPPTADDFTSGEAKGKPFVHPDPSRRRLWGGLSFYGTEAQARRNARRFHTHGQYIAGVAIEAGSPIQVERTLGPGHYTVWGEPSALLARVVSIRVLRQ